jgi:hypothetical protein
MALEKGKGVEPPHLRHLVVKGYTMPKKFINSGLADSLDFQLLALSRPAHMEN